MTTANQPPSARSGNRSPAAAAVEDEAARTKAALASGSDLEVDTRKRREENPAPQHPIPFMQDAFAESLFEATQGGETLKPKLRTGDAKVRREELLDQARSDPPPAALWRFRPGQINHELRRLMAQISFGVYLLLNGMANSQALVVSILQGHIDEVDEFLETTLEDIGLATKDLQDRISHLKLPMDNMEVFERMLEDPNFRLQILDGNRKIDHIVCRTQIALQQTMQDLAEGVSATREFSIYLAEQEDGPWRRDRPDVIDIYDAMKGNTDGWFNAFIDLQAKASTLNGMIVRLNGMVSEMERKADEACERTEQLDTELDVSSPRSSPRHSPRNSDASSSTVRPASPVQKIPSSPPRLSLRLSSIVKIDDSDASSFFDIRIARQSILTARPQVVQVLSPTKESFDKNILARVSEQEVSEQEQEPESTTLKQKEVEEDRGESPMPQSPPARNPRRISERPAPRVESPQNDDVSDGLYLLQPRTYTPQPPSPLPSPRVFDRPPLAINELPEPEPKPKAKPEPIRPPRVESLTLAVRVPASPRESSSPRFEQAQLRSQPSRPKLVAIGGRAEPKPVQAPEPMPEVPRVPEPRRNPPRVPESTPNVPRVSEPGLDVSRVAEAEREVQPRQRTSLRQRVSLKTTPPESIQIPPPNALEIHRPVYHESPRTYQAPDSAYGSDMERPPVNSIVSINSSLAEFPTPPARPVMVPSPHSDQQFFRPVQASPHSPLQQRPHTSGTVSTRAPPRNIPSAMGMSTLSNVTTMTSDTSNSRTLKKKRSAFGWLKKAFSLDEEERIAFEQKKREQANNLYYQDQSPKFLDGKRIQPRHQPQAYYANS